MNGYVYAIQAEGQDLFKIGHTYQNPNDRLKQLQTGNPFKLNVYRSEPTYWPKETEKLYQDLLIDYRAQGEWFNVEPIVIDHIFDGKATCDASRFTVMPQGIMNSVTIDCHIGSTPSCTTPSELEFECLRLIWPLLKILRQARSDIEAGKHIYYDPKAWEQASKQYSNR
jgi:Meiotically up-regulated gene 113